MFIKIKYYSAQIENIETWNVRIKQVYSDRWSIQRDRRWLYLHWKRRVVWNANDIRGLIHPPIPFILTVTIPRGGKARSRVRPRRVLRFVNYFIVVSTSFNYKFNENLIKQMCASNWCTCYVKFQKLQNCAYTHVWKTLWRKLIKNNFLNKTCTVNFQLFSLSAEMFETQ